MGWGLGSACGLHSHWFKPLSTDLCISTASELDSLPSSSSLSCSSFYYSTIHTISPVLLPPHLFMPITVVADTWLDSPLSTPPISHQSYKQVTSQLKNCRSLQSKLLSPLIGGSVPLHGDGTSLGAFCSSLAWLSLALDFAGSISCLLPYPKPLPRKPTLLCMKPADNVHLRDTWGILMKRGCWMHR